MPRSVRRDTLDRMDRSIPPRPYKPILSPCVLVCVMNPKSGLCLGCYRTLEEIERWRIYSDDEREAILADLRVRKKTDEGFTG